MVEHWTCKPGLVSSNIIESKNFVLMDKEIQRNNVISILRHWALTPIGSRYFARFAFATSVQTDNFIGATSADVLY